MNSKYWFISLVLFFGLFTTNADESIDYIHYRLGVRYKNEKKYDLATEEFRKVLAAYPDNYNAYMHLAEIHSLQNNPRLVIYYLQEALTYNPGWGKAHKMLAQAYEQDGQIQRAINELQQYMQSADPAERDSIQLTIDSFITRVGGVEQATEIDQNVLEEPSDNIKRDTTDEQVDRDSADSEQQDEDDTDPEVDRLFSKAVDYYNHNKYDSAIAAIRACLKVKPGHPGAYYYAGLIRRKKGQNRMARINFQRGLNHPNLGINGHFYLGKIFGEKKNYNEAVKHLRAYIENARNEKHITKARTLLDQYSPLVSETTRKNDQTKETSVGYDVIEKRHYAPIEIRIDSLLSMMTVDTLTDVGQKLLNGIRGFKSDRFDRAVNEFRKVLVENPQGSLAAHSIYNIGICFYKMRLYKDAQNQFEQFLDRFPNNRFAPNSMFLKTMCYQQRSDFETAERLWRHFIREYRQHEWVPLAWERLGDTYVHLADLRKAIEAYNQALNLSKSVSDKVYTYYKRGNVFRLLENSRRAADSYKSAIKLGEDNNVYLRVPDSYYKLADLKFKQRNFQKALPLYQRVTRKYPSFHETPWGLFQIANIHRNLMEFQNAVDVYKKLIEHHSQDYWARQAEWKLEDTIWEHEYRSVLRR
ncbi:tetratricopeptide repeat protein [Chitinispirillales bacterium ANBcel5]|uniref:tetratricopeptide repeat protein n=1 Tax=Cellulosispirillum alkaliphilum TaxID=3039283 RepID=UPI002A584BD9|nr:tetratricopeptide repeat protein [Chitinispirillales bacterium ANBcel5]